jgi:hypothetical protein
MPADSVPADLPPPRPDWDTNEGWAAGQYRIDWEKCRRIENGGPISTVWPANFVTERDAP